MFQVPHVCLTHDNHTNDSLDRSLARNNRESLADVPLSSEIQVYKIIVISSIYYRSVHDQSYTISKENNPTSLVLILEHANSWLTRAKSWLTQSMSWLTRANKYIETILYYFVFTNTMNLSKEKLK